MASRGYRRFGLGRLLHAFFLTAFTGSTVLPFARALALSARSRSAALSARRCSAGVHLGQEPIALVLAQQPAAGGVAHQLLGILRH